MFSYFKKMKLPLSRMSHELGMKDTIDWGLQSLNIPSLWSLTKGKGIKVAVLDTGIAKKHPDLKNAFIKGKDFTGKGDFSDGNGHSSHVSGIIAARANNVGVVGVAPECDLLIAKVLSDRGSGRYSWIVDGMKWALDEGADIISMSLGGSSGEKSLEKMCEKVIAAGKILIVAAGNSGKGKDTVGYPGHYPNVITVGSVKRGMKRSTFSSTGPSLEIMAPGQDILSCIPPNGYARFSGTSMATPLVSGVAALILAHHRNSDDHQTPCTNQEQMMGHLVNTAKDIEDPGFDNNTGWGIVDPKKAIYW